MTAALRQRNRVWIAVSIGFVVVLGLASRRFPTMLPRALGNHPGDALWALMLFLGWAFVFPAARSRTLAICAIATAFGVEAMQLYQAPWIVAIRSTTLGHLVLGSGFLWADLVAYTVGVAIGVTIDTMLQSLRAAGTP